VEHVVFFPAPDGTAAFRRTASLEDAVRLVEHLRNVEGVAEVSVRPLGPEVPLAFRAWYRVELPPAPAGDQPAAASAPAETATAEAPAAEAPEPAPAPVAEVVPAQPAAQAEHPVEVPFPDAPVGLDAAGPAAAVEEPVGAALNGSAPDARSLGFFA
jgi:hypothetical protein